MIGISQTMFPAMGTVNGISICGMDKINVLDKAKEYVLGLDKALSVFSRDSEITHFNARSGNWVCLSEDTFHIISDSVHMGEVTGSIEGAIFKYQVVGIAERLLTPDVTTHQTEVLGMPS